MKYENKRNITVCVGNDNNFTILCMHYEYMYIVYGY